LEHDLPPIQRGDSSVGSDSGRSDKDVLQKPITERKISVTVEEANSLDQIAEQRPVAAAEKPDAVTKREQSRLDSAAKIGGLKGEARHQYHKLELVEQITSERDRILEENVALKIRVATLHAVEVSFAKVSMSGWRERTFTAICTFAMVVGACLISAYPSGTTASWWHFSGTQLFAIGWALVLIAGALQFFKSVLGL
jgi:hypothetical protein